MAVILGNLPMMDRNLGAAAGYITLPPDELEKSKTNGFIINGAGKILSEGVTPMLISRKF